MQTFTIADPAAYARTVLIEALRREGVTVTAPTVAANPARLLPARRSYPARTRVARFVSPPYAEYSKLILKVSHNYGANLSLMYAGMTQGATTRAAALAAERRTLVRRYGIPADGFRFPTNGSGSPDSQATPEALMTLLVAMSRRPTFAPYFASLPSLGVDGSLASVGRVPPNAVIAPAFGRVFAKTGTTIDQTGLKAQNFAGYIDAASGRRLAYVVYVNDVGSVKSVADVIAVFDGRGRDLGAPASRQLMVRMTLFGTRRRWTAALVVRRDGPRRPALRARRRPRTHVAHAGGGDGDCAAAQVLGTDGLRHFAYELELVNPAPPLRGDDSPHRRAGAGQGRRHAARPGPHAPHVALRRDQAGPDARCGSGRRRGSCTSACDAGPQCPAHSSTV